MKPPGIAPAVFRFTFDHRTSLIEVKMCLYMAMIALEGLFGEAAVRLDASYYADEPRNTIIVDGTTTVGATLVRVFTALLLNTFDAEAFDVRRVESANQAASNQEAV